MEIKQFVLKYFLKKAELGNHISKIKNKKEERGTIQPSEPCPREAKQKETSPANKREARSWFHDFITAARQAQCLTSPHHQARRCPPDWYIPVSDVNDLFGSLICSLICYQSWLAVLAPCARTRTDPWLPGCWDASYLQPICCFYKFNLGIKELIVEPCRYNIFNPAVHHINRYRRGQSPIIPGSSTYL